MDDGAGAGDAVAETRISDLDLASFLVCDGARLVRIALTPDPTRRDFVLAAPEVALERGVRLFVSGRATVEPRRFSQARRALQRALRDVADEPAGRASSTPRSGR